MEAAERGARRGRERRGVGGRKEEVAEGRRGSGGRSRKGRWWSGLGSEVWDAMAAEPEIVADGDEADNPFLWDLDRVAGDSGKSGEKMEENLERKLGIRVLQRRSDGYGV